ncbi:MAG: hypothetical protein A2945_02190 [Candidatus Liptonbacteria bacterium RIFCSPLOWO2_01_FULL_52_25]|uniref:Uncharacterized protein n=1 Tax=Candidatus Liptonbacteria bacterium RIFCSPLOWO2_01_FULL_52_25 TaxID=1798650 RepID=A0A1G2CEF9_9BACT|nr:MAG: hypothetical protein A2945_02190 [Candidatus Liptonbacteria bacterium RIFCSPLOWO2_01_FULL_52_25]
MPTITQEQARTRFTSLPPSLQNAIFSVQTADVIDSITQQNNVSDEKASGIAEAVGLVLLGFIHPEELAQEIASRTGIAPQAAQAIATSLNNRICGPLKTDIDKAYAPKLQAHEMPEPAPVAFGDIKRPSAPPTPPPPPVGGSSGPPPVPSPSKLSEGSPGGQAKIPAMPVPPLPSSGATMPKPIASSTPSASLPVVSRVEPRPNPFPPTSAVPPPIIPPPSPFSSRSIPTTPASIPTPTPKPLTPPLSSLAPTPKPTPTNGEPALVPSVVEGPMMLHEEVVMKPIRPPSSFNLNIASLPKSLDAKPKETIPVKPAVLELGNAAPFSSSQKTSAPEVKMPRVVHYTELRTPLSKNEPAPAKNPLSGMMVSQTEDREVHEITASTSSPQAATPSPSLTRPPSNMPPTPLNINLSAPPAVSRVTPPPARIEPPTANRIEPPKMNDVRPLMPPPPPGFKS